MAHEIAARRDPEREREEDRGVLDPRFSPAQRTAAEERLAEARRERELLLAALAALGDDIGATSVAALAKLHRGEIHEPDAFGPRTARERAGGEVEARVAYTPDGHEVARWFVPAGGGPALVREEDVSGDGRADRWIAFRDGVRHEVWEARRDNGIPDVHYTYATRGEELERVEIDTTKNGRPDRVLRYDAGSLASETFDHNGDGIPERVDQFDADGYVTIRDEDLDGDGRFDMRSAYRAGRLVSREVRVLELAPDDS
jgi:hypothetical protein